MASRRNVEQARQLLLSMQRHARRDQLEEAHILLRDAIDDPARRAETVRYVAHYLSRCLAGVYPNIERWTPPK